MHDYDEPCNEDEGGHTFDLSLGFDLGETDGRVHPVSITVRTHIHNVPAMVVCETLVTIAHKMLSEHMAHDNFSHVEDHSVAHLMGSAAATALLSEVLKRAPEALHAEVVVPDDISELMQGE